jgi:two-component system chemotaxis sensor kinase CheA
MVDRLAEFVVEAREHLSVVEESLLAMEQQSSAADRSSQFHQCFRSLHSIKGDAGFLGLTRIHELAHGMESALSVAPSPLPPRVIETLLVARDQLAVMVDDPQRSATVSIANLLERLAKACGEGRSQTHKFELDLTDRNQTHPGGITEFIIETSQAHGIDLGELQIEPVDLRLRLPSGPVHWRGVATHETTGRSRSLPLSVDLANVGGLVDWFQRLADAGRISSGELAFLPVDLRQQLPDRPILWKGNCDTAMSSDALLDRVGALPTTPIKALPRLAEEPSDSAEAPGSDLVSAKSPAPGVKPSVQTPVAEGEKSTTLRIQVELLDRLMTLVGELTLVRNQSLLAFADEVGPQRAIIQRLNSVTSELQDATLRARMQPVGNLFNRFPRMVRDLAKQLGKQVEITLQGREVELDKTILEQLSDPLMHLVRNSVDHGIENSQERIARGKPAVGQIVLSALHEDGQVHIQIRDDGKGIDPEAVKAKALALRLKTETELERMSPRELFGLILLPGFSTARKVTEVSGRGVGMDVVKTNIEQLEGTLNIDSVPGLGCSMVLRLPLTLAIIPCLVVTVGEERFAVPQRELEEVVCLHPRSPGRIEQAFDTEVYRLREILLPIVRLQEVLQRREPFSATTKAEILATHSADSRERIEYILVLRIAGRRFGLVVDAVRGTQEVVVKPMHPSMKRVGIFTGATIMGDGRVALIIDSEGIIEHARLSFESKLIAPVTVSTVRDAAQAHRVLLFESGPQEQFALPLIQIRRIEMVSRERIEFVGDHEYVTIDGVSTRILRLERVINASRLEADPPQMSLILPKYTSQPLGIMVSRIVDTDSLALELQQHPEQDRGILGSAIVRDRLTLFLDIHRLSEKLFGVSDPHRSTAQVDKRSKRLLLIDDTAFFREVVKRYLIAEGHEVETAIHGEEGLSKLANSPPFDLIVSDIEMPVMDGWEFAKEARRRGIATPMLALTSLSGLHYESKAKECGYNSYEVKLDHDRLVRKVGHMLAALGVVS